MSIDDTYADLDTELRADASIWREQVDGLRPDSAIGVQRSQRSHRRMAPLLGGLAAAAVVLASAVLVLMLRHDGSSSPQIRAGNPHSSAPISQRVPTSAQCSDPTAGQSDFGASLAQGATGTRTIAGAVRVAHYGPTDVARWQVGARDRHDVLLLSGPRFLHATRLGDHTWFADQGGKCSAGEAIVPK